MKQPWEMTEEEFFYNRKVLIGGKKRGEKITLFPGGYETGAFPEIGYIRPDSSAVAFGKKITASEWDKYGIKENDLRNVAWRIREEIVEQALKQGKPVPEEVLKDYPNLTNKTNQKKEKKNGKN